MTPTEFFINGTNGISVTVKNGDPTDVTFFKSKKFLDQVQAFSNVRGGILSTSISIESLIESSIEYILFDEKNFSSNFFQNRIIRSGFLSFFEKWSILRELVKESPKTKSFYKSDIVKRIHESITIRNIFAHGKLVFDQGEKGFCIEYIEGKELCTKKVTQKYLESSARHLYECINSINMLIYGTDYTIRTSL